MIQILSLVFSQKRFLVVGVASLIIYSLIYLAATQHLIFTSRGQVADFFTFKLLPGWQDLLFRQRAPFLFEPIGAFYLGPNLKFFLSIPNLFLALLLGSLVGANIATSYYSFKKLGLSGVKGFQALLATLPAIVTGSACCVPTLILVIGLQLTATLATVWSFFVPLSVILLLGSLYWSARRIRYGMR